MKRFENLWSFENRNINRARTVDGIYIWEETEREIGGKSGGNNF